MTGLKKKKGLYLNVRAGFMLKQNQSTEDFLSFLAGNNLGV